ncbi:hypothetical protein [Klebsiella aerogenes]|nr:hypothetical protein [Klebsiella aerogenes]
MMPSIEEMGKRAALLKWKRQFGPFENGLSVTAFYPVVCYAVVTAG